MSKVNGQSVAAQRRACGRDPPKEKKEKNVSRETWACGLLPVDYTCGLWCVLVGGTHPIFYFCLRAGGILPALLFLFRNFSHLRT